MRWIVFSWMFLFFGLLACETFLPDTKKPKEVAQEGTQEKASREPTQEGLLPDGGLCPPPLPDISPEPGREFPSADGDPRCKNCLFSGLCTYEPNGCIAATDADCRSSFACWNEGKCTAQNGLCVVGSSADCLPTSRCREMGFCTAQEGRCVIGGDADCARSSECRRRGACAFFNSSCQATEDSHCFRSSLCRTEGLCVFLGPQGDAPFTSCITSQTSCLCSDLCRKEGRCGLYKNGCMPIGKDDAACRALPTCKTKGWCSSVQGICLVATDDDCKGSDPCYCGHCYKKSDFHCGPTRSEDCQQSPACLNENRCCIIGHGSCN